MNAAAEQSEQQQGRGATEHQRIGRGLRNYRDIGQAWSAPSSCSIPESDLKQASGGDIRCSELKGSDPILGKATYGVGESVEDATIRKERRIAFVVL